MGGGRNAAGDPGPWTGTAAGADQTDPYSLIEKFRSLYHRFCRLLDASASPRFLLRSACSDQGSGFVWTAPPFIKNNRQVTGCTRKPYPSRHPMGSAGIFLIFVSPVLSWSDRQDIPFPRERKQRKIRLRIFLCFLSLGKETEKDPAADIFLGIFVFIMPYMIESPDNTYMFIIHRWNRKCHPFPAIKTG